MPTSSLVWRSELELGAPARTPSKAYAVMRQAVPKDAKKYNMDSLALVECHLSKYYELIDQCDVNGLMLFP